MPLILFGWPDMAQEKTAIAVEIPHLGSLILTHSWNGQIPGPQGLSAQDRPNFTIIFWTFRIMVGLGLLMLLLGVGGAGCAGAAHCIERAGSCASPSLMGPAGLIAILAGWMTTEIGRQPWVVYGVMRTADAVSNHSALALSVTLPIFVVVYFAVFGTGIIYMLKLVGDRPGPAVGRRMMPTASTRRQRPARRFGRARRCDRHRRPGRETIMGIDLSLDLGR